MNPDGTAKVWRARLRAFGDCRICRRVTAVTFLAILTVEAVILVPSARNYERDRLAELDRVGATAARGMVMAEAAPQALEGWLAVTPLVGLRAESPDGRVTQAGEAISGVRPRGLLSARIEDGRRYETIWTVDGWRIAGRLDAASVGAALTAFLVRIGGLILVIALVVTAATMIVLERLVLRRVLAVRSAMRTAAAAPEKAQATRLIHDGVDELSDMTAAFNDMVAAVAAHAEDARTARRAAEAADAAKSAFLASMSHELRTPLNAVIGFAQILEMEAFGPLGHDKYRVYARDIRGSGDHLLTLINDILDLSKAQAGRLDLHREPVALTEVWEGARRMIAPRAEEVGVALEGTPPDLVLRADAHRLRQVLLNLLSNAVKFSPRGGAVRLSVALCDDGGVEVAVADQGPGMTAEQIRTAFEPFGQVDNQAKEQALAGTGLGLPIARQLVEAHGGALVCDSVPGRGTVMRLRLPADCVQGPLVSPDAAR